MYHVDHTSLETADTAAQAEAGGGGETQAAGAGGVPLQAAAMEACHDHPEGEGGLKEQASSYHYSYSGRLC